MLGRRNAIDADRNTARCGDLGRHLRAGQHAAMAASQTNDFRQSRRPRLLIDGPQSAAGTVDAPSNETALISTRTNVSKASACMSCLRVKGYRLSCFYGFIDLNFQLTDCVL